MLAETPRLAQDWRNFASRNGEGGWFIVRTRARQEKILARELLARDIAAYLPLQTVTRRYGQRSVEVESPLFPRILFLYGSQDDVAVARATGRVTGVRRVKNQPAAERELDGFRVTGAMSHSLAAEAIEQWGEAVPESVSAPAAEHAARPFSEYER